MDLFGLGLRKTVLGAYRAGSSVRRWAILVIGAVSVLAACGFGERAEVVLSFANNSDSLICVYPDTPGLGASTCPEVRPGKKGTWGSECVPDNLHLSPVTVVLTVGLGGKVIYKRTAMCSEWIESGAEIEIDQTDGKFVVTVSLPGDPLSP